MKLIKLYQPSCSPCEMVENLLQDQGVQYVSVNVQEKPEVAGQYGVMGTPVVILLDSNDEEIQRSIGFKPDELEEMINKLNN